MARAQHAALAPLCGLCHLRLKAKKPRPEAYPDDLITIGDHVRKRRLDLGLLQKDVADRIGVNPLTIKNWEVGHTEPEIPYGPAIIDFLGYAPIIPATSLPQRLRDYRWVHGCSQERAANHLGVDESTWRNWEAGPSRPSPPSQCRIRELIEPALTAAMRSKY